MRASLGAALALITFAASGCGGTAQRSVDTAAAGTPAPFRGNAVSALYPAPGFALRDQTGATVRMADERGRVVLVTFLYTHCPDICPLIASRLNAALQLLPAAVRSRTRVLAISVDPEHDTPAAVDRFISERRLLPQFRYLSGSRARLKPIWQAYNVIAPPAVGGRVNHSAYAALIDRRGRMRVYFDSTSYPADIAHDIERLAGVQPSA